MSQPISTTGGMPPGAASAAGRAATGSDGLTTSPSTDDGVPVGAADAEADARRSGADGDELPQDVVPEGALRDPHAG